MVCWQTSQLYTLDQTRPFLWSALAETNSPAVISVFNNTPPTVNATGSN